jgi:hypothetical protein
MGTWADDHVALPIASFFCPILWGNRRVDDKCRAPFANEGSDTIQVECGRDL